MKTQRDVVRQNSVKTQETSEETRYLAQSAHKVDDGVAVEPRRAGEDAVDGHHDALRFGLADALLHAGCSHQRKPFVSFRSECKKKKRNCATPLTFQRVDGDAGQVGQVQSGGRIRRRQRRQVQVEVGGERRGQRRRRRRRREAAAAAAAGRLRALALDELRPDARADQLGQFQLADALEDLQPRLACGINQKRNESLEHEGKGRKVLPTQIVAVGVGDGDERLDGVDVLGLDLGDGGVGREQREARQRLNEGVALRRHVEDAGDADGAAHAVQTQRRQLVVVAVLQQKKFPKSSTGGARVSASQQLHVRLPGG